MTKILLVDDHEVVRMGMRALLESQDGYVVIGEAGTEDEAVERAAELSPDIILMDIRLQQGSGIQACKRIIDVQPAVKIIMLTSYSEDDLLFSAIRAGASGYVLKQVGRTELLSAIESARRGDSVLDTTLTQTLFSQVRSSIQEEKENIFKELTAQEMQVLALLAKGETNRKIGDALFLSHGTVRNYVSNILGKLYLNNRAEATAFAIKNNINDFL